MVPFGYSSVKDTLKFHCFSWLQMYNPTGSRLFSGDLLRLNSPYPIIPGRITGDPNRELPPNGWLLYISETAKYEIIFQENDNKINRQKSGLDGPTPKLFPWVDCGYPAMKEYCPLNWPCWGSPGGICCPHCEKTAIGSSSRRMDIIGESETPLVGGFSFMPSGEGTRGQLTAAKTQLRWTGRLSRLCGRTGYAG